MNLFIYFFQIKRCDIIKREIKKSKRKPKKSISINKCPECGSKKIRIDRRKGEKVCSKCGLVIKDKMIDSSAEWRAFDAEQMKRKTRGGAPLTHTKHDKGMTTEVGRGKGELFKVTPIKRAQYYRLRKWQKRLVESKARNLSFALSVLTRLISVLGLPKKVHEEVARKYEQAVDKGLVRGRSMESVVAALLYIICRKMKTPRTLEEISQVSGVTKRELGRTYRYVARNLNLRILPAMPEDYIPRFGSMLGLSGKTQATALRMLKKADKLHATSGKGPTGVAAASLYIAALLNGEKRTQREIADTIGVTEVTIRNRFKELVERLDLVEKVEKELEED